MKKTLNWTSTLIKEKSLRVNRLFPVACLLPPASIRLLLAACLLSLVSVASQAQTDDARYTTLLARLNSLKAEATQVEDLNAITRLGRAFAYYLDKGYFGEAANLFADEGRVVYGVDGVYTGRDRIKELFTRHGGGSMNAGPGLPFGRLNMHMHLQPLVTISADGRSAQARWREWGQLGNYKDKAEWSDAILENDYIKEDGVWKVREMRYYINFVAPYIGGWASLEPAGRDWRSPISKDFKPDQRSPLNYNGFPEITVPPFHYADNKSSIMTPPPVTAMPKRPDDALGKLETRADQEALKLARVHAVRAVENLQAMFGYYFDKGLWRDAADLFTDDGTWEFGQYGVYQGKASIARGMTVIGPEGLEPGQLNNFPMLQPVIHVSEDNSKAWGRFRSDVMRSVDGPDGMKGQWGGGLYENEYINDNGTWKISKQHYWVTYWGDYDKGWVRDGIIPVDQASTEVPPDAPPTVVYESLPHTYVVPFHYNHPVTGEPHDDMGRLARDKAAGKNVR